MEKTKEEILKHLLDVGYNDTAMSHIQGYLYGKDIIALDEDITYLYGDCDFLDFIEWLVADDKKVEDNEREDKDIEILVSIFDDICDKAMLSDDVDEIGRYIKQMEWLTDTFDLSASDED